jgi:hypothetical protein
MKLRRYLRSLLTVIPMGKSRKADVQVSHLSLVGYLKREVKSARPHTGRDSRSSVKLKKKKAQDQRRTTKRQRTRRHSERKNHSAHRITSDRNKQRWEWPHRDVVLWMNSIAGGLNAP